MANFPVLKTGAVAQYPLARNARFQTQSVRFLDGSSQRYRLFGNALRSWAVNLTALDEQELSAVIAFGEAQGTATFTFTDPASGASVANCIISGGSLGAGLKGELDGQASLVIEETL
jgi:phage-related protein